MLDAVRQSETILSLPAILSSLSPSSMSSHLTTFRRDLTTHYIDRILTQPTSVTISTPTQVPDVQEYKLTPFPSPPNTEIRTTRLQNLAVIFSFLDTHLFPYLPDTHKQTILRSLGKPVTSGVLNHLLIPSLPSSLPLLPTFLDLVQRAVEFEEQCILTMFGGLVGDEMIQSWADGVGGHYERKRRLDILETSRIVITHAEDEPHTFRAEVVPEPEQVATTSSQVETDPIDSQSWGLDDEDMAAEAESPVAEETGWGFDDDIDLQGETVQPSQPSDDPPAGEDPGAAWGWNDDELSSGTDESAWDDPWNEEPTTANNTSLSQESHSIPSSQSPKAAAGLEKSTAKAHLKNSSPNSSPSAIGSKVAGPKAPAKQTAQAPTAPKDTYLVSNITREIVKIVEEVLKEGKEFASSKIMPSPSVSSPQPGSLILQTAVSVLDLFQALYPIKFGLALASPERSMRFSNDCIYLSEEVARIERLESTLGEKLAECRGNLRILGDSWFDDAIVIIFHSAIFHPPFIAVSV